MTGVRLLGGLAVGAVGALGAVVALNHLRFGHRVAREARQLGSGSPASARVEPRRLERLPPPVRRYATTAIAGRERAVRTARLRHGGRFRAKLDGAWWPIRGTQYLRADPPAFVWWGRLGLAPGLWVDALDRSVAGAGRMLISAESTVTLADRTGPELDQGALVRLLGELVWLPTAYLDERYVTWTAIDPRRARATLRVAGREVTGVFEFGEDGLPRALVADRYLDRGGGPAVLTPWRGEYGNYRTVEGLLVPHQVTASWHGDGPPAPYAQFRVEQLDYDAPAAERGSAPSVIARAAGP
jgi:hypothetical protein